MESNTLSGTLPSKNAVRRAESKIKTELSIIEKIVASLKEVYALNKIKDADTFIEALDKEADEIMASVDEIIENAENMRDLTRERKNQFCFEINHMQMMTKLPWHPHL